MTNLERWKDEILQLGSGPMAIVDGRPSRCRSVSCEQCERNHNCTEHNLVKWLISEYQEPEVDWSKVAIDTPIWVRDFPEMEWTKGHFAKYQNGLVYIWLTGKTSWTETHYMGWKYARLAKEE